MSHCEANLPWRKVYYDSKHPRATLHGCHWHSLDPSGERATQVDLRGRGQHGVELTVSRMLELTISLVIVHTEHTQFMFTDLSATKAPNKSRRNEE
jgi:hypothetical protein